MTGHGKRRTCKFVLLTSLTAIVCALNISASRAAVQDTSKMETPTEISRESFANHMKDGAPLIEKWLSTSESYASYEFDYQMTVYKSGGTVTDVGHLCFKKNRLLKIEQTGGPKKGSIAVLGPDGKVRGRSGGRLGIFGVVTLAPDSGFLKSSNGWPMVDSDFVSLAQAVVGYIKNGDAPFMTETPVNVEQKTEKVNVFELYKGGPKGEIFKRALFNPETNLPVEWWDYVDGKLWAHSVWTNFKTSNLADSDFTVKRTK